MLMFNVHRWFLLLGFLVVVFILISLNFPQDKKDADFNAWVKKFVIMMQDNNLSKSTIQKFTSQVEHMDFPVVNATNTGNNDYYTKFDNSTLLLKSQLFIKNNLSQLKQINDGQINNIPLLVAMLAVSTSLGDNIGSYPLTNVLASRAYDDVANKDKYERELLALMKLIDQGLIDNQVVGKVDGTFTFLGIYPTTYIQYAIDGDGDGVPDLMHSKADILASANNIVSSLNIDFDKKWGFEVFIPSTFDIDSQNLVVQPVSYWLNTRGLKLIDKKLKLAEFKNESSSVLVFNAKNRGVLIMSNFALLKPVIDNVQDNLDIWMLQDQLATYMHLLDYKIKNVKPTAKKNYKYEGTQHQQLKKDDLPVDQRYREHFTK